MTRFVMIGILGGLLIIAAFLTNLYVNDAPPERPAANATGDAVTPEQLQATRNGGGQSPTNMDTEPGFDVVRISPEGDMVIAGRAAPNDEVRVLANNNGKILNLGAAVANDRGEWVLLSPNVGLKGETSLTLQIKKPDGTLLEGTDVVLASIPDSIEQSLVVLASRRDRGVSRILQMPENARDEATGSLSVNIVDYNARGDFTISGHSDAPGRIRISLNNAPLGTMELEKAGPWRFQGDRPVPEGHYNLRVELLNPQTSATAAQLDFPFERLSQAALEAFSGNTVFVVQPGNNLWRIARRTLGSGPAYSVIYRANRQNIGDPDLIYPGQVFELPTE